MSTTRPLDFYDTVRELTRPHQHREPYTYESGRWVGQGTNSERYVVRQSWPVNHPSDVPPLIHQLLASAPSGTGELSGTSPQSRPAARIEALDTVMLIDDEAGEWVDRLGGTIPADRIDPATLRTIAGSGTVLTVSLLGGLYPSTKRCGNSKGKRDKDTGAWCCPRHQLEHDVRRWWHQARIITGWDSPAFKPHNTCPICDQRDSLRIRTDAALCVECRTIWEGPDELGILARHIQTENGDAA